MLITTSRRPGRLARILCRELALVIPGSFYVPRGLKTLEDVAAAARKLGQGKVLITKSVSGGPRELRFLEVGQGWRWADAVVEISDVKIRRDTSRKSKLKSLQIHADGAAALEFAEWLGQLLGLGIADEMPSSGGVALILAENGLRIQFKTMPSAEAVGPSLRVTAFGGLSAVTAGAVEG